MTGRVKLFTLLMCLYVGVFGIQQLLGWPIVRIWGASPWGYPISADLASVLNSATCLKNLPFESYFAVGLGECGYIYGNALILLLNAFGLTAAATTWLSWLFILIAAGIFSDITARYFDRVDDKYLRIAGVLAFCSPPVALLLERANFDLIIFAFAYLGALGLARNRWALGTGSLAMAILMKFYALFSLALFFIKRPKRNQFWAVAALFMLVLGVIAIELGIRKPSIPVDIGGAFGAQSIGLWFNFSTKYLSLPISVSNLVSLIIGWAAFGLAVLMLGKVGQINRPLLKDLRIGDQNGNFSQVLAIVMGLIFFGCYLAGANFDYRLVFFLPFALTQVANASIVKNRKFLMLMMLLSMWLSYDSGVIGQILGDGVMIFWSAVAFMSLYASLENSFFRFLRLPKYAW